MKIFKVLIGLLALLFIVFVLLGFMVPGVSYSSEVIVNKNTQESWNVMSDETKLSQGITGYKRSQLLSGIPNTVGTVSNIYIENQGTESVIKETVTELALYEVMAMDFSMDPMDMEYKMTFVTEGRNTVIKSSTYVKGNGWLMRSMVALMKGGMQSQEDINMNKLQKLINDNEDFYPYPKAPSSKIKGVRGSKQTNPIPNLLGIGGGVVTRCTRVAGKLVGPKRSGVLDDPTPYVAWFGVRARMEALPNNPTPFTLKVNKYLIYVRKFFAIALMQFYLLFPAKT